MADPKTLRVLFIAAEADPIIKVGGLGDVTGSLPRALKALAPDQAQGYQVDVRLVIPFHPAIRSKVTNPEKVAEFSTPHPQGPIPTQAYLTHLGEIPVYLIDGAPIPKAGPVYSLDTRLDGEKFTFFSLAALELARALNWQPDIVHAHDWHAALAVYTLAQRRASHSDPFFERTRTVLSIHNLAYMGGGAQPALQDFGIPPAQDHDLPGWAASMPLPMGLATADFITTVSPTYAREILTPEFGYNLQDFLQCRACCIAGILNGLDESLWDPATDKALPANFSRDTLDQRAANKQALLRELDLPPNLDLPLLVFIGRMDRQKGVDLVIDALHQVAGLPWQAILLGTGEPGLEAAARQLEAEFPYRVRSVVRFDGQLARRLYAGGDMLLMPSRYEPCGLAQMIAMRYGSLPVARATGGLRDTVLDTQTPARSTGFLFEEATPEALAAALRRAIAAFNEPDYWQARQRCGMEQDFSWPRSAQAYVQIYHMLLS